MLFHNLFVFYVLITQFAKKKKKEHNVFSSYKNILSSFINQFSL